MKKNIVTVVLMLAMASGLKAQYSDYYYHRVGDTIEWRSEIGYYSWWEWKEFYENNLPMSYVDYACNFYVYDLFQTCDSGIILERFYTPAPLKIIGIAGIAERGQYVDHWYEEYGMCKMWVSDTDSIKEYFLIYDAIGDSFPLVAQAEWSPFDTMRTLHFISSGHSTLDSCCANSYCEHYVALKEYYFDNPIFVDDSFYVGGTYFGGLHSAPYTYYGGASYVTRQAPPCNIDFQQGLPDPQNHSLINNCVPIGLPLMKFKGLCVWPPRAGLDSSFFACPWRWYLPFAASCMMVYPIIEVDTTVPPVWACDSIANVQVTVVGSSATVTWDDFPNYSRVLLRYGRVNEPQSQWREEDVTGSTLYTLPGLQPVSYYSVMLMAECDTCKKETPWSEPVTFYVPADTSGGGTEGVEGATLLSRLTFLQPNPAQDEVMVTSSFNLTAIDIWTADGVMVYHGARAGHDATVDVSWLRAGTYIVAIHTHNGTTHKRLVIAR